MIDWADHLIDGDSSSIVGAAANSSSYYSFESSSSMFDSTYTYSNGKLSCMKEFFTLHTIFNYMVFVSGLICLVSRLLSASTIHKYNLNSLHSWSGRIYIISMLWSTATSLVINNEGLPIAVITTFGGVMGGLTFGWISILIYQQKLTFQATQIVQEKIIHKTTTTFMTMVVKKKKERMMKKKKNGDGFDVEDDDDSSIDDVDDKDDNGNNLSLNLNEMINGAKADIIYHKTFVQRFFSFKALHGILFFVSWMQITGRLIFSSHLFDNTFSCRSYPVYKPLPKDTLYVPDYVSDSYEHNNDQKLLFLMPIHDPEWERKPWSNGPIKWGLMMISQAQQQAQAQAQVLQQKVHVVKFVVLLVHVTSMIVVSVAIAVAV
ncbi:hypothetical protein FRACYDRAFT_247934 [Fragilariopsis cylindrus CCMP1102]|uniref:Uncharacterized protein n=1 Tax=Fragilariopsis cylindrus CCMP1102 TaxID=635003 RepID=A0A1E7EUG9_9STRA|nr:hypothetical protein FRACYDRAFT_247934 [Fragilariopsis cylindrus CCMP1102]|eukprot:OEU09678.1 hypothetical protein FRACYDRAFT_247934 [Fragilariopsis cylindrus CCMP1102]